MIRDKNKIYGEANAESTVLVEANMLPNKYVIGTNHGTKTTVKTIQPLSSLMTIDAQGKPYAFPLNTPNRLVGVNGSLQLELFERITIPDSPPSRRELVAEVLGSTTPGGALASKTITLEGPHWYEVEIIGAGGGGGSGIVTPLPNNNGNGTDGGEGGYYRGTFPVTVTRLATIVAGAAGGAAAGWGASKSGKSIVYTGDNAGGEGGRTPIIYEGVGGTGVGTVAGTETDNAGGLGTNSGANGGSSTGKSKTATPVGTNGTGGGGANGEYGGNGGNFVGDTATNGPAGSYILIYYGGGGGGAGGGFGVGGPGGNMTYNNGTKVGGSSYGGGGGGRGVVETNGTSLRLSGGGGGGGGGSRLLSLPLDIRCGGGGGGAGGGTCTYGSSTSGSAGKNSVNAVSGGGNNKGHCGLLLTPDDVESSTKVYSTKGTNGGRGVVRIWRRIP